MLIFIQELKMNNIFNEIICKQLFAKNQIYRKIKIFI